jgi:hypothetical protein
MQDLREKVAHGKAQGTIKLKGISIDSQLNTRTSRLTQKEREELTSHMIERWKEFAARATH